MLEQVTYYRIGIFHFFQNYFYFEVGFDRVIFSGNPTLKDLKNYSIKASPEEQGYFSLDVT
jgi:hypothetical protein